MKDAYMKIKRSTRWSVAKQMPPLRHSFPGQPFDFLQSEVVAWLFSQPEIAYLVFNSVKDHGEIVYDPGTGTWRGVEYGD